MKNPESIVIVDDDVITLTLYETILRDSGYQNIITSSDGNDLGGLLEAASLVLLDVNMPGISGIEVLEQITESHPTLPVIMITGDETLQTVVKCMKIGAYDYLTKPPDPTRLITTVRHALEWRDLNSELTVMGSRVLNRYSLENPEVFTPIITRSDTMIAVFQYVEAVAPTVRPVLLIGESGTGKELLARATHEASGRSGDLVTVNVAGLDDALFSDTLFGHRKGAFTGAGVERPGLVEKASGGTLFLDEIGDLSPASQVKLLRLLQEKEYYPLGSDEPITTDARIITATCIDLESRINDGRFRRDLFFRLMAHNVTIPPLRIRQEDLMLLVESFLETAAGELDKAIPRIPLGLEALLYHYEFPGNVRELHSLVFDAMSRTNGTTLDLTPFRALVDKDDFSERPLHSAELSYDGLVRIFGHFPTIREANDAIFSAALERTGGNQSEASRLLGVNQSTLSRRLAKGQRFPMGSAR